jgi:sec-independent protein translocase protein TatC
MARMQQQRRSEIHDREIDHSMGFLEHLDELRTRIIRSCIAIAVGMVVAFFFYERLGEIVLEPARRVLPPGSELVYTSWSEMFALY